MSELKPFPPTPEKLQELREQGIFPRSAKLEIAAIWCGLLLGMLWFMNNGFGGLQSFAISSFRAGAGEGIELKAYLNLVVAALGTILVPIVSLLVVVHLLQSKFLISFSLVKIDFSRFGSGFSRLFGGFTSRFGSGVMGALLICVVLVLGYYSQTYLLEDLLPRLDSAARGIEKISLPKEESGTSAFKQFFTVQEGYAASLKQTAASGLAAILNGGYAAAICLVLIGVAGWFVARLQFSTDYAMSRGEVEAEVKQGEMSPGVRQALQVLKEE